MTNKSDRTIAERQQRLRQSAHWFSRHEAAEELSTGELHAWQGWLEDPDNRSEYEGFISTYWYLRSCPRPPLPCDDELRASVARQREQCDLGATDAAQCARNRAPVFRLAFAVIAVSGMIIALTMFLRYQSARGSRLLESARAYATAAGEQREFILADGSVVTLAGDSHLTVTFAATRRIAVLAYGEARFRVHHDRGRPFTVLAGLGSITAVGTVFDVRRYSDRVFVTVSEGAVEVAPRTQLPHDVLLSRPISPDATRWVSLRVAPGEEMAYDMRGEASATRRIDAHLAESWTQGSLAYRGRPLREVIEDVQRYSTRRVVLDPNVADLQYTGTFVQRDLNQWLRGLSQIFPVEIVEDGPDRVLIRSQVPPQQDNSSGKR